MEPGSSSWAEGQFLNIIFPLLTGTNENASARALRKTAIILDKLEAQKKRIDYFSLDLDKPELLRTLRELQGRYKYVKLHGLWGTYDDGCKWLSGQKDCPPFNLLWLGSSIGNLTRRKLYFVLNLPY